MTTEEVTVEVAGEVEMAVLAAIEVVMVEREVEITTKEVHLEGETEAKTTFLGSMVEDEVEDEVVTGITTGMPETRTTKTSRTEETDRAEATTHTTDNIQTTSPTPRLLNKNDDGRPVNLRRAVKTMPLPHPLNNLPKEDDST